MQPLVDLLRVRPWKLNCKLPKTSAYGFVRGHTSPSHFRKINWLPVKCRVELCTSTTAYTGQE